MSYDGGIFSGLYSMDSNQNVPEPYPIGTAVSVPDPDGPTSGYVLATPSAPLESADPQYTIQLTTGDIKSIPLSVMDQLVSDPSSSQAQVTLPSWIQYDAKVRFTISRLTHQGPLHLSPTNS